MIAGCSDPPEKRNGTFGFDLLDEIARPTYAEINFGMTPKTLHTEMGTTNALECDETNRYNPNPPDPEWMRIRVHNERILQGGGDTLFLGNWTGIECNHQYVFRYHGPGQGEFYEATYPDRKKIRDMPRVAS